MDDLQRLRDRIGAVSVQALQVGGEPLLGRVESMLGIALRHSQRIIDGTLPSDSQMILQEMEDSIERAEQIVNEADAERTTKG